MRDLFWEVNPRVFSKHEISDFKYREKMLVEAYTVCDVL